MVAVIALGLLFGAPVPKELARTNCVEIVTTAGSIVVELFPEAAPKTVANFLKYADDGFYDGLVFHRVIPKFMIQGGGHDEKLALKKTREPVVNEAHTDRKNSRGTIAMARTAEANSATSQFFINGADNKFLDKTETEAGYCVFGRIVKGTEVADAIAAVKTKVAVGMRDVPEDAVIIKTIRRVK